MDRKRIYLWSLIGFFLMWGVFGFVAAGPRNVPDLQVALPPMESTSTHPDAAAEAIIPVTGEAQSESGDSLVYILLGFIAVLGILGLLNAANKPASTHIRHKGPPDKS